MRRADIVTVSVFMDLPCTAVDVNVTEAIYFVAGAYSPHENDASVTPEFASSLADDDRWTTSATAAGAAARFVEPLRTDNMCSCRARPIARF